MCSLCPHLVSLLRFPPFSAAWLLCLRFATPAKTTASRIVQKCRFSSALRMRSGWLALTVACVSCHFFSGASSTSVCVCVFLCQHGCNHSTLHPLLPSASGIQMAAQALLYRVVLHDRRFPRCPKGSRSVRAPGVATGGRQLLRLWLGE